MSSEKLTAIAVLKARASKREDLRGALLALIEPTRAEPGNLDYALFELCDSPGTFYMRETFIDAAALDQHKALPHFQAFAARLDELLAEPLELIFLDPISA